MKTIKGNLIDLAEQGLFDVIVHGANCHHMMGAGIAKEIKERYPEAYHEDKFHTSYADLSKLGSCSWVTVKSGDKKFIIVNAYTQFDVGRDAEYIHIENAFKMIRKLFGSLRYGIPKIGCGLGGLEWHRARKIIDAVMKGLDITVVEFQK